MTKQIEKPIKKHFLLWVVFVVILASTLVAELFTKMPSQFGLDGRLFFHAWYGLISCIVIVLFARILGIFLKRRESYYKEHGDE